MVNKTNFISTQWIIKLFGKKGPRDNEIYWFSWFTTPQNSYIAFGLKFSRFSSGCIIWHTPAIQKISMQFYNCITIFKIVDKHGHFQQIQFWIERTSKPFWYTQHFWYSSFKAIGYYGSTIFFRFNLNPRTLLYIHFTKLIWKNYINRSWESCFYEYV